MNTGPQSPIERMTASYIAHPNGTITTMRNFGGYDLRADTPDRLDSLAEKRWPIGAVYADGPKVVYYWDGSFRSSSGAKWGKPSIWFYWRLQPEVWHPVWQQWVLPGTVVPPVVTPPVTSGKFVHMDEIAGQWMVDILKRSFTWEQIMTFGDRSPYDEPDTGVPEGPL